MTQEDDELYDSSASLLTERQIKVLQLRRQGRSQQEVADSMGTTRPNISILEKRAHKNIARARKTLRQWMTIQAPISLKVPKQEQMSLMFLLWSSKPLTEGHRAARNVSGHSRPA